MERTAPYSNGMLDIDKAGCDWPHAYAWLDPVGHIRPCCNFKPDRKLEPSQLMSWFNGADMESLRADLAAGVRRSECQQCWLEEDNGQHSDRTNPSDLVRGAEALGTRLRSLEFGAGRTCNLMCRMCSASYSTAIEQEDRQLGKKQRYPDIDIREIPDSAWSDLQFIKVTGGEPFLNKRFATVLQRIADLGHAENIEIRIFTNTTAFPDPIYIEPLLRFRSVVIKFSIDCVGKRNEYIRSGSSWTDIIDSLHSWGDLSAANRKIRFEVQQTLGIINGLYLQQMVDWLHHVRTNIPGLDDLGWGPYWLWGPANMSIFYWPAAIKRSFHDSIRAVSIPDGPCQAKDREQLDALLKIIDSAEPRLDHSIAVEFFETQRAADRRRGQDLDRAVPELIQLLKQHDLYVA